MTEHNNNIQSAIEAGRDLALKSVPFEIYGIPSILVPQGYELRLFNELRNNPTRIEQYAEFTTAKSFIDYYNEFSDENSIILINEKDHSFLAILDYHGIEPGWCNHKALFKLKPTPEWLAWKTNSEHSMNQEQFGQFIESNLEEIISPAGAEMLEIALSIQAKSEAKFSKAIRLDNGQLQLSYVETIDGTAGTNGQLKIPQTFTIGLKLYSGGDPYQIEARLRYRIKEGNLLLWYELIRPHKTVDANIEDTRNFIEQNIKAGKIYAGTILD